MSPMIETLTPLEAAEALANREGVEERLRRMLVRAVAGVDDRGRQPLGEHLRRAGMLVADDDHVRAHRHQVLGGVDERFALSRRDEPEAEKLSVSAERRFSAISNETRVRVDASMKRLMTSCPRSAGTFLTGRSLTSLKPSAVSRMRVISSGVSGSMPRRSLVRSEESGRACAEF